jgi:hypothetical protein
MFAGLPALLVGRLGSKPHQRARPADCEATWQRPSVAELTVAAINDCEAIPRRSR